MGKMKRRRMELKWDSINVCITHEQNQLLKELSRQTGKSEARIMSEALLQLAEKLGVRK